MYYVMDILLSMMGHERKKILNIVGLSNIIVMDKVRSFTIVSRV